jgi:chromosome segregation ATPase
LGEREQSRLVSIASCARSSFQIHVNLSLLLLQARDAAKKQLQELSSQCRRLEREHNLLTRQVQELNDELESSKAYIAILLQSKDQSDEWQKKEKEYQNVISNLKAQVRSGEASVSLALYRKAVDESRARAVECQDKRLEINTMSRKLQVLEARLKEKRKIQTRASPPEAQSSRPVNLRKVTPTSSANSNENYEPKTPSTVSKTQRDRPPPPPPTPRISALREAGGRAGLCAKLKQMRRSPLVNKN